MRKVLNLLVALVYCLVSFEIMIAQTEYIDFSTCFSDGDYFEYMSENPVVVNGTGTAEAGDILFVASKESVTYIGELHFKNGSSAASAAGDDVTLTQKTDADMNWTEVVAYGESGEPVSWNKSYVDGLGRGLQSQALNISTNKAMVSQSLYDDLGRPVISTLAVPVNQTQLKYIDQFVVKSSNETASYTASDTEGVGTKEGTLGWYYSSNNTDEAYLDHTSYPYTRVEYSETQPGAVRKTTMAGDEHKMGSGREIQSYTMPASDNELSQFLTFDSNLEYKGLYKTITIDPDGKQSIVYRNREGRVIASCLVKENYEIPQVLFNALAIDFETANGEGYLDIHLPPGITTFNYVGGFFDKVIDLSNDNEVSYTFEGENTVRLSESGVYRLSYSDEYMALYKEHGITLDIKVGCVVESYYLHSFNIYDQRGRLIKSYSPLSVQNNTPDIHTSYTYNSLGWLMKVNSPDEGETNYVYRADGSIRFSQNAQQNVDGKFSYTVYDNYGRPIESGEYIETSTCKFMDASGNILLTGTSTFNDETNRTQRHKTWYGKDGNEKDQEYVHGAVSKTSYDGNITYYSYTYDGKVDWVIRDHAYVGEKKIEYTYDFLGNVVEVAYQKDQEDQDDEFIHYYEYDKSQRLEKVFTSTKGGTKELQAKYQYYPHGALKRVELAEDLQGIDYVYNINGLLKSINHASLETSKDPGGDGNNAFNKDVFGLTLDYYSGDYTVNDDIKASSSITSSYAGNIALVRWNHSKLFAGTDKQWAYKFGYTKRNYLYNAIFGKCDSKGTGVNPFTVNSDYSFSVLSLDYDANGNIEYLARFNTGNNLEMDNLDYIYSSTHPNRLNYIRDIYGDKGLGDMASQGTNNYSYNAIGQMISDASTGKSYEYDARGKTKRVVTSSGTADYYYDDMGFRSTTEKPDGTQTFYIRDLSGNIMAIYDNTSTTVAKEYPIYGSGRIGVTFGNDGVYTSNYELTDHLGNVRAVISKKKDKTADILSYADYYPFGWKIPGRQSSSSNGYRFGYQGQFAEEDKETGLNQFEARLYDPRIGRWLTTDPAGQFFSPYLGMGNNPIMSVDPDGRLTDDYTMGNDGNLAFAKETSDNFDMLYTKSDYDAGNLENGLKILDQLLLPQLVNRINEFEFSFGEKYKGIAANTLSRKDALNLFKFAAGNSNVEWSYQRYTDGSLSVATANDNSITGTGLMHSSNFGKVVAADIHSHPGITKHDLTPSGQDYGRARKFQKRNPDVKVQLYMPKHHNSYARWFDLVNNSYIY